MTLYNQQAAAGDGWQRANTIVVSNPLTGVPAVTYVEEFVVPTGPNRFAIEPRGNLVVPLIADGPEANIGKLFQPVDPQTLEPVGPPITYGYFAAVVAGHYVDSAMERDAANAPPVSPDP